MKPVSLSQLILGFDVGIKRSRSFPAQQNIILVLSHISIQRRTPCWVRYLSFNTNTTTESQAKMPLFSLSPRRWRDVSLNPGLCALSSNKDFLTFSPVEFGEARSVAAGQQGGTGEGRRWQTGHQSAVTHLYQPMREQRQGHSGTAAGFIHSLCESENWSVKQQILHVTFRSVSRLQRVWFRTGTLRTYFYGPADPR